MSEINPATAATIGSPISVGSIPEGIAFDGTNLWVSNNNANTVSKINPTTASVLATVTVGQNPSGVAFDGTDVWVTYLASVAKIDPTTDDVLGSGGNGLAGPTGLVFDGSDMWVTNEANNTITKLRAS